MLTIRLYISALTLVFLFLVISYRDLGILEGVVITCAILYLILDVRSDLQLSKLEFRLLQDLEQRVSELRRQIP
jgi:preprotein translocase subunit SecD